MKLNRRRFLTLSAAAAISTRAGAEALQRIRFQALGADCQITLAGKQSTAEKAVADIREDLEQVEQAFSLYRPDSELSRLNRDGYLLDPSMVFVNGFKLAQSLSRSTHGAFDPTVQTRWLALANGTRQGPVDWSALIYEDSRLQFARPGMSATFNGIAQGIATDRATAILKHHGYSDVLANLGEFSALGSHPDGRAWQVGVENPVTGQIAVVLSPTTDAPAIATSEPNGTQIAGLPHIFDPFGREGPRWSSVCVQAKTAAHADGLSTAIAAAPVSDANALLERSSACKAVLLDPKGNEIVWRA